MSHAPLSSKSRLATFAVIGAALAALVAFALHRASEARIAPSIEQREVATKSVDVLDAPLSQPQFEDAATRSPVEPGASTSRTDAAPVARREGRPTIELHVLDAQTRQPLDGVTARLLTVGVGVRNFEPKLVDGAWVIDDEAQRAPGPHIVDLHPVAYGPSPLRVRPESTSTLWVTARGHGWARLYFGTEWPSVVRVSLHEAGTLALTVTSTVEYERIYVDLTPSRRGTGGRTRAIRRIAKDGKVQYAGLPPMEYRVEIHAYLDDQSDQERAELLVVVKGDNTVHRNVFLEPKATTTLNVNLSIPHSAVADPLPTTVHVLSEGTAAERRNQRQRVSRLRDVPDTNGSRVVSFAEPLRVPVGTQRLLVLPHGVQFEVLADPGLPCVANFTLPELVAREIVVHDVRTGEPLKGRLEVRLPDLAHFTDSLSFTVTRARVDPATGIASVHLPTAGFEFGISPPVEWLQPAQRVWPSGSAVPEDLRLEVRTVGSGGGIGR